MTSRRNFLKTGSSAIAGMCLTSSYARAEPPPGARPGATDPLIRELALQAMDAAKSAGAHYADIRFTTIRRQAFVYGNAPVDREDGAVGVRVYVDGAWGFAGGPLWSSSEVIRLVREAVTQARANRWPGARAAELGLTPPVRTGSWTAPIERDPFTVSIDEKLDFIRSLEQYARQYRHVGVSSVVVFKRFEHTFASTDGSLFSQTRFESLGDDSRFAVSYMNPHNGTMGSRYSPIFSPSGAGYEALTQTNIPDTIQQLVEEAKEMANARPDAILGRYDVVFDGYGIAPIVSASLGGALELDRALTLEANAGGTSYLRPEDALGMSIGPTWLNVYGERSSPGGAATVKLDDDGVEPSQFSLVEKGSIVDYATNREHAMSLHDWYQSRNMPLQSRGCARTSSAMHFPIIQRPNIHLAPNPEEKTFEDLVSQIDDGIAIKDGMCAVDHQHLNGQGLAGIAYRIRGGKLAECLPFGTAYMFRSPEFWKNIMMVGGSSTVRRGGIGTTKGQPEQTVSHSASAPATIVRNVTIFDLMKYVRSRVQSGAVRPPSLNR